jgi:hypothetical protein
MREYTCVIILYETENRRLIRPEVAGLKKCFVSYTLNVVVMAQTLAFRYESCKTVSGVTQKSPESTVPREWRVVRSVTVVILPDLSPRDATVGKEFSRYYVSHCFAVSMMC